LFVRVVKGKLGKRRGASTEAADHEDGAEPGFCLIIFQAWKEMSVMKRRRKMIAAGTEGRYFQR
jgi:hypothetical protein